MNGKRWTQEELVKLENLCEDCWSFLELKKIVLAVLPERTLTSIKHKLEENSSWTQHFEDRRQRYQTQKIQRKRKAVPQEIVLTEKNFPKAETKEIDKEAWEIPGARVGFLSGIAYKSDGYRAGLIKLGFDVFKQEAIHFNVLNGGIVSKQYISNELKKRLFGTHKDFRPFIIDNFLNETAQELASVIPKIKKPKATGENGEYVRLYVMTSLPHDGMFGEEIVKRLQGLRPEDIRHYKQGGDRLEVKQPEGVTNKIIWSINPKKSRLPTKYHSQAAEREIDDKRGQTTKEFPELWAVGPFGSNIHKPSGERDEPYITMGVLRRLEEVFVAENQISVSIVEYTPDGDRFVRVWDLKDIVANELSYITGIKNGANDIHRSIVDIIKKRRPITIGLISDELGIERKTIAKEIEFLVEEEKLPRKTWPGLYLDPSSQRYDFHLNWLQDQLTYPKIQPESMVEDRILFFSCPHVGYTTTDYAYIVQEMPKRILKHNIKTMVSLGDFIAGLKYNLLERGEIFGSLNYSDQEKFAAELMGTVFMRVFEERFKNSFSGCDIQSLSPAEVEALINEALITFVYIAGNHDDWQAANGSIPLETLSDKLTSLLVRNIEAILIENKLPAVDLFGIVGKKLVRLPDYDAVYTLPSGLQIEMFHPYMARAKTTSLRAQETLDVARCQIVGIGNFHTATVVNKWFSDKGQCVAVQAGTLAIYTMFEKRKLKVIDFGSVYLRVLSRNKRIAMTESAFFDEQVLTEPIAKWTNLDQLKEELKIISVP